jgi:hypothetical protein
MSSTMDGDNITSLPINRDKKPIPGDIELLYNLFQPKNEIAIKNGMKSFKLAFVGALIFLILNTSIVNSFVLNVSKNNPLISQLVLFISFIIIFWIFEKFILK